MTGRQGENSWIKAAIHEGFEIAKAMDHRELTGAHLLVSLVSESDWVAGQILRNHGMRRQQALDYLRRGTRE